MRFGAFVHSYSVNPLVNRSRRLPQALGIKQKEEFYGEEIYRHDGGNDSFIDHAWCFYSCSGSEHEVG